MGLGTAALYNFRRSVEILIAFMGCASCIMVFTVNVIVLKQAIFGMSSASAQFDVGCVVLKARYRDPSTLVPSHVDVSADLGVWDNRSWIYPYNFNTSHHSHPNVGDECHPDHNPSPPPSLLSFVTKCR